jgi:hypothetical protein
MEDFLVQNTTNAKHGGVTAKCRHTDPSETIFDNERDAPHRQQYFGRPSVIVTGGNSFLMWCSKSHVLSSQ